MSKISATVLYVDEAQQPYFLVNQEQEFMTTTMHQSHQDTALGSILSAWVDLGWHDFDHIMLDELAAVHNQDELMTLYTFELTQDDRQLIEEQTNHVLQFLPAAKLHELLEQIDYNAFSSIV